MKKILLGLALGGFLLLGAGDSYSQQKELSYEQIFKAAGSNLLNPLPVVQGWADDSHYLIQQKDESDNGKMKLMSVDVKSGKGVVYVKPEAAPAPPLNLTGKEKNPTVSPDGKWVAFTRDNNLFAKELGSGKEIQFSKDGSENIYNGYSSWLYNEEILGRASRYKAFWWSPDSKRIAYMHTDETEVPVFPIYGAEGQHGYLERQHYPKAGDKNPTVKIGITSVENPVTVWCDFDEKADQYFGEPFWTPDGISLWVQWMPRLQNNLKIY